MQSEMNRLGLVDAQAFRQALGGVTGHAARAVSGAVAEGNLVGRAAGTDGVNPLSDILKISTCASAVKDARAVNDG
jgi:hypothetical protein